MNKFLETIFLDILCLIISIKNYIKHKINKILLRNKE